MRTAFKIAAGCIAAAGGALLLYFTGKNGDEAATDIREGAGDKPVADIMTRTEASVRTTEEESSSLVGTADAAEDDHAPAAETVETPDGAAADGQGTTWKSPKTRPFRTNFRPFRHPLRVPVRIPHVYDEEGYDEDGFDRLGKDRDGYDRDGYNSDGFNRQGYNRSGYKTDGYNDKGHDRDGKKKDYYQKRFRKLHWRLSEAKERLSENNYVYAMQDTRVVLDETVKMLIRHFWGKGAIKDELKENVTLCKDKGIFTEEFNKELGSALHFCNIALHELDADVTLNPSRVRFAIGRVEELLEIAAPLLSVQNKEG